MISLTQYQIPPKKLKKKCKTEMKLEERMQKLLDSKVQVTFRTRVSKEVVEVEEAVEVREEAIEEITEEVTVAMADTVAVDTVDKKEGAISKKLKEVMLVQNPRDMNTKNIMEDGKKELQVGKVMITKMRVATEVEAEEAEVAIMIETIKVTKTLKKKKE